MPSISIADVGLIWTHASLPLLGLLFSLRCCVLPNQADINLWKCSEFATPIVDLNTFSTLAESAHIQYTCRICCGRCLIQVS